MVSHGIWCRFLAGTRLDNPRGDPATGRPPKSWREVIAKDLKIKGLAPELALTINDENETKYTLRILQ